MTKAKLILAAIAVFSTVGGLLAFKAKTLGIGDYCTTNVEGNKCDQLLRNAHTATSGNLVFYTTTTGANCNGGLDCEAISTTIEPE